MEPKKRGRPLSKRNQAIRNLPKNPNFPLFTPGPPSRPVPRRYSPVKLPEVSQTIYKVRPLSKVVYGRVVNGPRRPPSQRFTTSSNIARKPAAELKKTSGGRVLLQLERKFKKVPTWIGKTKLVSSRTLTNAKPRVAGKLTNAQKIAPMHKGKAIERDMLHRIMRNNNGLGNLSDNTGSVNNTVNNKKRGQ